MRAIGLAAIVALGGGAIPAAAADAPARHARSHPKAAQATHGRRHEPTRLRLTLLARPAHPVAGRQFEVVVLGAPGASAFHWNLDGRSSVLGTGGVSRLITIVRTAGPHTVSVRARSGGVTATGHLVVVVSRRPGAVTRHAVRRPGARARLARAGDPGVTIVDFAFSPPTTTVHVGDTITWTNTGAQPHTATANDNSFNTGILKKGQSGSHTFSTAGTFTYFCQVHPFMKGTVVVLAATTTHPTGTTPTSSTPNSTTPSATTANSPSSSPSTPTSTPSQTTQSGSTLPFTGMNVLGGLIAGVLLLAGDAALRRITAPDGEAE